MLPPNAPPALPAAAGPLTTAHDTAIINIGSRHLNILVFGLGGGTFDVTLLAIDQGVYEVLATPGDTNLGGEDFDQRIMAHFTKQITKERRVDISKDARALQKLRKEAERARRELSSRSSAMLEVDVILNGDDFLDAFTRAKVEQRCADLLKKAAASRGDSEWRQRAIGGGEWERVDDLSSHTARKGRGEVLKCTHGHPGFYGA